MKFLFSFFLLCLCSTVTKAQATANRSWIEAFREFRNAVYTNDKAKVKSFIDFPIMNESNEIWMLVYGGNEKAMASIPQKIKPFTVTDFDKYYSKIFSKSFTNAILKVKTDELLKKGETETVELKDGKNTTYKMIASFDKENNSLTLNLALNTVYKDEKGEVMDGGELNIFYYFDLTNNQVKFRQIRMAG